MEPSKSDSLEIGKTLFYTISALWLLVTFSFMSFFKDKDLNIYRAIGITVGCIVVSPILLLLYLYYRPSDRGTGLTVFGFFLYFLPFLAGVMFMLIGANLKLQEDGTYKMGDAEPPFGKTAGPNVYYIAGSFLIAQFLIYLFVIPQSGNKGDPIFTELPGTSEILQDEFESSNQQEAKTSSKYLDSDGIPNFKWKCTKADKNKWLCEAEMN